LDREITNKGDVSRARKKFPGLQSSRKEAVEKGGTRSFARTEWAFRSLFQEEGPYLHVRIGRGT